MTSHFLKNWSAPHFSISGNVLIQTPGWSKTVITPELTIRAELRALPQPASAYPLSV